MRRHQALRPLGELEEKVMAELWGAGEGTLSVREVSRRLGARLANPTVMTTLDRGLLAREKDGIAFRYRARIDRDEYHRRVVKHAVSELLSRSAEPVLAGEHLRTVEGASFDEAVERGSLERLSPSAPALPSSPSSSPAPSPATRFRRRGDLQVCRRARRSGISRRRLPVSE